MKQLTSQKLSDLAATEIVSYIVREKIAPGEKIPSEKFFSEYFGISRPSVREGMSRLMSFGLLHPIQGYGVVLNNITIETYFKTMENSLLTRFINLSPPDVESIIETRLLLEQHACRCFLATGTDKDLDPMRGLLTDLQESVDNAERFREKDVEFHHKLVALSHNTVISNLYSLLRAPADREIEMLLKHDDLKEVQKWHDRILDALECRDPAVCDYLRTHLLNAYPRWLIHKEDRLS